MSDVEAYNPDFLFHLGAFTDLEFCESNIEETYRTNTISVENATLISNKLDIPLLYISTAGIFDGSKDTFDESGIDINNQAYKPSKISEKSTIAEKSKIAEDLLISMGQLFGPIPGGLGISVIFVGAKFWVTSSVL